MYCVFAGFIILKIALSVSCAVFSYKIARMNMTPTFTYMLYFVSYLTYFTTQVHTFSYANNVSDFMESLSKMSVLKSQIVWIVFFTLQLVALYRTYDAVSYVHNNK